MTDLTLQPRLAAKRRSRSRSRPSASCPSSVPVCVSSSSLSSSLSSFSPSSSRSSSSSSSLSTNVTPSKAANPRAPSHCCDAKAKPDHVVPALPTSAAAAAASAVVVSSSSAVATRPAATNTTTITNSITTNSITNTITTPTTPSAITTPTTITTNTTITTTTPTITTITITTPTTTTTRTSSSTTTAAAAPASSPSASPSSTAAVPCTRTPAAAAAAAAAAHCRAPRLQQPSSLPSPRPRPLRSQPESLPQQAPSLARPSLLPPRSISFDLPRIPPPAARPPLPPPRRRLSSRRTTDPAAGAGPSSFSADRLSSLASFVSEKTHHFARRASVTLSASSVAAVLATTTSSDQFLHDHPHDHHHHHHHHHRNRNIRLAPSSSSPPTPQSHNSLHSTVANERRALVKTTPSTSLTSRPASFLSKRALPSPPPPLAFPPTTPDAISLRKLKKSASTESLLDSEGRSVKTRGKEYTPRTTTTSSFSTKNSAGLTSASNKMHQTSSRLLRMTDEDRPFTRDFKDLFSTLIVSLPLSTHRFRFKTYPFSFASEEAINNLGSLKFSQSNRMPDPKDPSRIVTTTTTTTFSMAKEMARSVCQRFMDARFIELADGKTTSAFPLKGCLWQLTPKGIHILERFCQRNGIQQEHVLRLLNSTFNTMRLVILERDPKTDKLSHDKFTTEVIFRRFAGQTPNTKANISISDNDSVSDYQDGQTGVKLAESRKIFDRVIKMSFTGKCAVDWLLDCCTTVERAETYEICTLFVQFGLIQSKLEDRVYVQQSPASKDFQPTKNAIYVVTDKGKRVAGWIEGGRVSPSERNGEAIANGHTGRGTSSIRNRDDRCYTDQRETNTTRLQSILSDPALRLLYREFLRETVCEENLTFYLDVTEFNKNFHAIDLTKPDAVRETLAAAYGLYNAFLAPGSPCELNIDHPLRQDMASRMTRAVAKDDASMYTSLKEVAALFERAQQQVFKLMAGDSVPKFIRTHKYLEVAGDILDDERIAAGHGLHRSASRSARFHNGDGSR